MSSSLTKTRSNLIRWYCGVNIMALKEMMRHTYQGTNDCQSYKSSPFGRGRDICHNTVA